MTQWHFCVLNRDDRMHQLTPAHTRSYHLTPAHTSLYPLAPARTRSHQLTPAHISSHMCPQELTRAHTRSHQLVLGASQHWQAPDHTSHGHPHPRQCDPPRPAAAAPGNSRHASVTAGCGCRQLAAAASSGAKPRPGKAVCEVRHQKSSQGAYWAPDGSGRLLSISFDDTLKVWADLAGPAAAADVSRLDLHPQVRGMTGGPLVALVA